MIHFAGQKDGQKGASGHMVIATSLADFLNGRTLEVKDYSSKDLQLLNDPETVVNIARAHIGDKQYSLLFNNSEHFANYCTINVKKSEQIDEYARLVCGPGLAEVLLY